MFIQSVIRRSPSQTGIQLAHRSSDKSLDLYDAEERLKNHPPGLAIVHQHSRYFNTAHYQQYPPSASNNSISKYSSNLLVNVTRRNSKTVLTSWSLLSDFYLVVVVVVVELTWCSEWSGCLVSTVRAALYAETLATIWTTAASLPQRPSAQLAAVCLFLATLTIAARCYASSNATHPLVQFNLNPSSLSPIDNSNAQVPHSSNLVLSRLLKKSPHQSVQSDTSIIVINSKKLLHNQNSNSTTTTTGRKRFRTKREIKSSLNNIKEQQQQQSRILLNSIIRRTNFGTINKLNLAKRSDFVSNIVSSATNTSVGDNSERVNTSSYANTVPVEIEHQNDSSYIDGGDTSSGSAHFEETDRPMPPVHDHSNASSVSDLGILVLILSAIVLTVALGLITCVLSHYRPLAGEGAADGGTAADPHDAARTPTTAPMLSVVSAGAAAGVGGMDRLRGGRAARELAATRDRQVRLHAVHTDLAINLPPSIAMPDGEEHPFASSRLHVRDPEQESEIHQKCIRPPPNRTVLESESPPPYRSSSAGLLGSSSSCSTSSSGAGGGDWSSGGNAPLVVRCHSMSSTSSSKRPEAGSSGQKTDFLQRTVKIFTGGSKKGTGNSGSGPTHPIQTLPVVIVPTRPRRTSSDQQNSAATRSKPSV